MSQEKEELPGYWLFLWMFWMQPISLHYWLQRAGVDEPEIPGWRLLKEWQSLPNVYAQYYLRLFFVLLMSHLLFLLVCVWIEFGLGVRLDWVALVGVAAGGMAGGMLGGVGGASFGVALVVVLGITDEVVACLAAGVVTGLTASIADGILVGMVVGGVVGVAACVMGGVVLGLVFEVAAGAAFSLSFIIVLLRLPLYLPEAILQWCLSLLPHPQFTLRHSPILSHDLIYLPLPRLTSHIVAAAQYDPKLARQALEAAERSPGQKRVAATALAELQAIEITTHLQNQYFPALIELRGEWLPGQETEDKLLQSISTCARYMQAAIHSSSAHIASQRLRELAEQLQSLQNAVLVSKSPLARHIPALLTAWRSLCEQQQAIIAEAAANTLPNPFVVQIPLAPDLAASKDLFRGRETLIREVESCLADANQNASLLVLGPRRCGKSSLLNMLRLQLPDTLVLLLDLQGLGSSTPQDFYLALSDAACRQARETYQLSLPAIAGRGQIEDLRDWLQALEGFPAKPRILLCMDEFERLEILFPGDSTELQKLMGLFRATIQHKRRLRLLFAGAAPFDEVGRIWHDHLLNLREMRIGYFDLDTACSLLLQPYPAFPSSIFNRAIAEAVFTRCHGHPFLTQAYGYTLIERLNAEQRKQAELSDVEAVESDILIRFAAYFHDLWFSMPQEAQHFLQAQAENQPPPPISTTARRWLRRRLLLDKEEQIMLPLFLRWVAEREQMD